MVVLVVLREGILLGVQCYCCCQTLRVESRDSLAVLVHEKCSPKQTQNLSPTSVHSSNAIVHGP